MSALLKFIFFFKMAILKYQILPEWHETGSFQIANFIGITSSPSLCNSSKNWRNYGCFSYRYGSEEFSGVLQSFSFIVIESSWLKLSWWSNFSPDYGVEHVTIVWICMLHVKLQFDFLHFLLLFDGVSRFWNSFGIVQTIVVKFGLV